jgi:hypothetical protein
MLAGQNAPMPQNSRASRRAVDEHRIYVRNSRREVSVSAPGDLVLPTSLPRHSISSGAKLQVHSYSLDSLGLSVKRGHRPMSMDYNTPALCWRWSRR